MRERVVSWPCTDPLEVQQRLPLLNLRFSASVHLLGPESLANVDTDSDYEQIQLELRLRDERTVPRRRTLDARTVPRSRTLNGILALCR